MSDHSFIAASWTKYTLIFKELAITSRARMQTRPTYFLTLISPEFSAGVAIGEVPLFQGLSAEDTPDFEAILDKACRDISRCNSLEEAYASLPEVSSIRFGFESACLRAFYNNSPWTHDPQFDLNFNFSATLEWLRGKTGIEINGLVWMGTKEEMHRRIREKLDQDFHCVKLKIGGIHFEDELELLAGIRREYSPEEIELRLDANGSFTPENALERLNALSDYEIHSIEQPIKPGQWEEMARLCRQSPIPIALDEELIGFRSDFKKAELLNAIHPQYIILKPSLCGGFVAADHWIELAKSRNIGWWGTSALESNIGLEALGIWTAAHKPVIPQGLGTGHLYTNNLPSGLLLRGSKLYYTNV